MGESKVKTVEDTTVGSATYIETIYGTRTFARALMLDDAQSIMDLMDDFLAFNNKVSQCKIVKLENRVSDLESMLAGETQYEQMQALETRNKELEDCLTNISKSCDGSNPTHFTIWHLAEQVRNKK